MKRLQLSKAAEVIKVKAETGKRIIKSMPLWRQHNALVTAHFLLAKQVAHLYAQTGLVDPLTPKEQARLTQAHSLLNGVKTIRAHGEQMERDVADGIMVDRNAGWDEP
ncbi:MAG: hypothetical protein KUG64_10965 [Cycloclasticus sp.]|nr:hypothetical protein [Cycloclasticus sp.]